MALRHQIFFSAFGTEASAPRVQVLREYHPTLVANFMFDYEFIWKVTDKSPESASNANVGCVFGFCYSVHSVLTIMP